MRKRDYEFWDSARKNNGSYLLYYDRLVEMAISRFKWEGMPDTVDTRFLELTLFSAGQCLFFEDEVMGYLTLPNAMGGPLNQYRIPTMRRAYAVNGYNKSLTDKDSVIIWNNNLHVNSMTVIKEAAERLWDLDRTIDVNTRAQKTPVLILCDENQRLSLINLYKKYIGNEPMIAADKSMNLESFKVLKTDAPYVSDKLYELKTQYWNEALTYLGISNMNFTKKARVVTDEVERHMGGVIANRMSALQARQDAADQINKMFGLNVSVSFREDYEEDAPETDTEDVPEGVQNE